MLLKWCQDLFFAWSDRKAPKRGGGGKCLIFFLPTLAS